jgi:putative hydrolase of the HAD superfamily
MDLQAVIFDYGEVLSGPPDPEAHRNLLAIAEVEEEAFEKAYWAHRLDYDADILNGRTYWQTVASAIPVSISRQSRSASCWNRTPSCG